MRLSNIKQRLVCGGISEEMYKTIEPDVNKSNLSGLKRFSLMAAAALLVMLFSSLVESSLEKNRVVYLATIAADLLVLVMAYGPCSKHPRLIRPCMYIFLLMLLCFGVALCTFIEPNEVAVSFVILLFALPLLFTDRPVNMMLVILAGMLIYTAAEEYTVNCLADTTRAHDVRGYNMTNVYPYGLLSTLVSTYMMQIKIERFAYIEKSRRLSETDQMTGLLNRRSYSIHLEKLKEEAPDTSLIVCSIDLNGLKVANDTLGHSAGDELLCGAAACVREVLGEYGPCYRTEMSLWP